MQQNYVCILGQQYNIVEIASDQDSLLSTRYGYCDDSSRKIVLCEFDREKDKIEVEDIDSFKNKVLRHEIIHAFLIESGLKDNCDWHCEEMVDWLAMQFPKIKEAFDSLKI